MQSKAKRNSNIELLRIVAMLIIVAHHYAAFDFFEEELAFSLISSSGKVVRLLTSPQGSCLSFSAECLPQLTPRPHCLGASVPVRVCSEGEGVYMRAKSL